MKYCLLAHTIESGRGHEDMRSRGQHNYKLRFIRQVIPASPRPLAVVCANVEYLDEKKTGRYEDLTARRLDGKKTERKENWKKRRQGQKVDLRKHVTGLPKLRSIGGTLEVVGVF
jgi:hypothetical protein